MGNIIQYLQPNSPIFYVLIAWAVIWKGVALWHAARGRQLAWYIALLIINTAGILEIIYLIFFRKKNNVW
jgi:methionyl-tRNA synthetase